MSDNSREATLTQWCRFALELNESDYRNELEALRAENEMLRKRKEYLMKLSEYFEDNHDDIFSKAVQALAKTTGDAK